jgi:ATP-dependent Clp protease ATP-binding subunit ClpX
MINVNTENILFICGGAFDGISKGIASRLNTTPLGFTKSSDDVEGEIDKDNLLQYITAQDLKNFGLIPELIGRLPVLTHLDPLTSETLKLILTEPKNALVKQYKKLFEMEDIDLTFEDSALEYIVKKADDFKLGARGLRSICEIIMTDAMFDFDGKGEGGKLVIDKSYAKEKFEKSKFKNLRVA